ncbi:MAG: methyltransferase [Bryobacteraceae bacterium]
MERLPDGLLERINAFRESRLLLTAIELDIFTAVGEGATAAEVAGRAGTDPRATEMLLNALAAVGVLGKREGVFYNTPESRLLREDVPESARMAMMHVVHLWESWSLLSECVRKGTRVRSRRRRRAETDAFIAMMHYNAGERAPMVVEAIGLKGVRRVLDLGGGSGAYAIAFAQASPAVEVEVFDLASVLRIARRHIQAAGLEKRVKTRAGDLRRDPYGEGYDLVFISAICHMLDPDENRAMLRKSYAALRAAGRVAIQDFILEPDKTAPRHAALFALNMLVNTRGGSSYSEPEYRAWLEEAGFRQVQRLYLPGPTGLMIGHRLA